MSNSSDPDEQHREFSGDSGERLFWSEAGGCYTMVEAGGSVWECDFSGYRVTELPADAVELRPVSPSPAATEAEPDEAADAAPVPAEARRLSRIAEAHSKNVDSAGGSCGDCVECGWNWPCATYVWATEDRDGLAPWNPADDEEELSR